MAAPLVAGAANLVWASHPGFTAGDVGACLTSSASVKVAERDDKIPGEIRDPDSAFPVEGRDLYILDAEAAVRCGGVRRAAEDKDGNQANSWSDGPVWSPDGTKIAFLSGSSNLVPGDTNNAADLFVKDLYSNAIQRISTDSNGAQANDASSQPTWSPDGAKIAFTSDATNLVPGDTNDGEDIFVKDLATGAVQRVSVDKDGNQATGPEGSGSWSPAWSPQGQMIAFATAADSLVAGDANHMEDVFLKNLVTGDIQIASRRANGVQANENSTDPVWSPDGTKIAFISNATNLGPADANGTTEDVMVKDLASGEVSLVSANVDGTSGNKQSTSPSWSRDGSRIAFVSHASDLVDDDTNDSADVFVKNLSNGILVRVSTNKDGQQANSLSRVPSWSPDGTKIAFSSFATNLVPGETVTVGHVYVKDLATGEVRIASKNAMGEQANAWAGDPAWSPAGAKVAFVSGATNLSTAIDTNAMPEVFVKYL